MTPEQKSELRAIAAALIRCDGMPPEDLDYLPPSALLKLRKELHAQAAEARLASNRAGNRIMRVIERGDL